MRKLFLLLCTLLSFTAFAQPIIGRSGPANTVADYGLKLYRNLLLPRFADTTAANTMATSGQRLDSCGALISTFDNKLWKRDCNPKQWSEVTGASISYSDSMFVRRDSIFIYNVTRDTTYFIGQFDSTSLVNAINTKVDSVTFNRYAGVDTVKYWINGTSYVAGYVPRNDGLISGGVVTWLSGLTFEVSAAIYSINGTIYTSPTTQIILNAADATNPRIDLIALNTSGAAVKITGTAATNPAEPQVDIGTQLALTSIYIPAGSTTPQGVSQVVVYDENTEWAATSGGTISVNFASTAQAYNGTKSTAVASYNTGYVTYTNTTALAAAAYTALRLSVRLTANLTNQQNINVQLLKAGNAASNTVQVPVVKNTTGAWQNVAVNFTQFSFSQSSFDAVRVYLTGNNSNAVYLDYVVLQSGIVQSPGPNPAPIDTANKWVRLIQNNATNDSIIYYIGSTRYAIKDNGSGGGGGTGTVTNVATGYGLLGGPITTTGTVSADSSKLATKPYLQYKFDSLMAAGVEPPYTTGKYLNGYGQYVTLNTDSLTEGSTNLFFTNARVRAALSAGWGLSYNSTTGVYAADSLLVQKKMSAGTGIVISGNTIYATGGGGGGGLADSAYFWKLGGNAPSAGWNSTAGTLGNTSYRIKSGGVERAVYDSASGAFTLKAYGSGNITGAPAKGVAFDNTGKLIETSYGTAQVISRGTYAQRPASPDTGQIYWQTDRLAGQWIYDGAKWNFHGDPMRYSINTDFSQQTTPLNSSVSGTGAVSTILDVTGYGGYLNLSTGTTTTGYSSQSWNTQTNSSTFYLVLDSLIQYTEARVRIPTLSDATDNFTVGFGWLGHQNAWTFASLCFIYNHGTNSGNWTTRTRKYDNTSNMTNKNTGVPVVAGQWYKLGIEVNGFTNTIYFYIDDVLVATHTTADNIPLPGATVVGGAYNFGIAKSAGTNARTLDIDNYMRYYIKKKYQ